MSSSGAVAPATGRSFPAAASEGVEEQYMMGTLAERNHWFPVAFADSLDESTLIPFDLFNVPWVAFRNAEGDAGCIKDECAHRACPLSLGKLVEGKVQCPYHGWEYTIGGECTKMPSIKKLLPNVYVDAAPVVERDGLLYLWAGQWAGPGQEEEVMSELPESLSLPAGFETMAEVTVEINMEAQEVIGRLMDVDGRSARAPKVEFENAFDEISDDVFPKILAGIIRGLRKPVPRSTVFRPTCTLESTIALEGGPGEWNVHQTHVVLPARPGKSRVLFRFAADFVPLPGLSRSVLGQVWQNLAEMVLHEQLEEVRGGGSDVDGAQDALASYEEFREEVSAPMASRK